MADLDTGSAAAAVAATVDDADLVATWDVVDQVVAEEEVATVVVMVLADPSAAAMEVAIDVVAIGVAASYAAAHLVVVVAGPDVGYLCDSCLGGLKKPLMVDQSDVAAVVLH